LSCSLIFECFIIKIVVDDVAFESIRSLNVIEGEGEGRKE
jgi:hypothetical protein